VIRTRFAFGGTATEDVTLYALGNGLVPPAAKTMARARVPTTPTPPSSLTPTVGMGPLPPLSTVIGCMCGHFWLEECHHLLLFAVVENSTRVISYYDMPLGHPCSSLLTPHFPL
jgi:hypothetical protein